jgi:integration host factor subunit alpha
MGKTKADLAEAVYKVHGGLSRHESRRIVDLILDQIRDALVQGDSVLISGFGTFKVRKRRPRIGRNPRTGRAVPIAASSRPVFRPSRIVLKGMNTRDARKERSDA